MRAIERELGVSAHYTKLMLVKGEELGKVAGISRGVRRKVKRERENRKSVTMARLEDTYGDLQWYAKDKSYGGNEGSQSRYETILTLYVNMIKDAPLDVYVDWVMQWNELIEGELERYSSFTWLNKYDYEQVHRLLKIVKEQRKRYFISHSQSEIRDCIKRCREQELSGEVKWTGELRWTD